MTNWKPEEIVVNERVKHDPVTTHILEQCEGVPVRHVQNGKAETIVRASETLKDKKTLLDNVLAAAGLISAKSPDDSTAFSKWLLYLAQQTAEGSKEGSFLGIGGVRVSEKEKIMLAELSQALGVEAPGA